MDKHEKRVFAPNKWLSDTAISIMCPQWYQSIPLNEETPTF